MLFIFLLRLFKLWPLKTLSIASYVLLIYNHMFAWAHMHKCLNTYFLTLQKDPCSFCILPAPILELTISPKSPSFFYWRTVLETKVWELGELVAPGVLLPVGLLR